MTDYGLTDLIVANSQLNTDNVVPQNTTIFQVIYPIFEKLFVPGVNSCLVHVPRTNANVKNQ